MFAPIDGLSMGGGAAGGPMGGGAAGGPMGGGAAGGPMGGGAASGGPPAGGAPGGPPRAPGDGPTGAEPAAGAGPAGAEGPAGGCPYGWPYPGATPGGALVPACSPGAPGPVIGAAHTPQNLSLGFTGAPQRQQTLISWTSPREWARVCHTRLAMLACRAIVGENACTRTNTSVR